MNMIVKFTSRTLLLAIVTFYSCKKEFLNHPPVANAGPNQTIILPVNSVILDGTSSTDLNNNIASYAWTKNLRFSFFYYYKFISGKNCC